MPLTNQQISSDLTATCKTFAALVHLELQSHLIHLDSQNQLEFEKLEFFSVCYKQNAILLQSKSANTKEPKNLDQYLKKANS